MKRILRFARRALSLMLCLAMVMTTMFFFDIGVTESDAKVSINSQNLDKIVFYVPEVIYLYPNAHSWKSNTTSNFQYYVQDNVEQMISNGVLDFSKSPTISKTPDTTGKIYFACDQNFEINATMTYKFVDSNGNKLPESAGGIVNWSGYQDHRNYSGRNYDYIEFNGTSPSLAANVSGCYIEWELIYDITETGERKSVYAYTYVYKPYMVPVGAASRAEETHNDSVFSQHATWISGAHNFTRYDTAHGNETATAMAPKFASGEDNYGLLGFLSSQPIGYTDEAGTATNTGVKANVTADRNVAGSANSVFYNSGESSFMYAVYGDKSYLDLTAGSSAVSGWLGSASDSNTMQVNSFDYYSYDHKASSRHLGVSTYSRAKALMYIDTSRYDNLNQIPNLGVAMFATDADNGDEYAWYIADASKLEASTSDSADYPNKKETNYYQGDSGNVSTTLKSYTTLLARQFESTDESKIGIETGQLTTYGASWLGLKYAGAWHKSIESGSSYTYAIKTYFGVDLKVSGKWQYAHTFNYVDMIATQTNKSSLRNKVYEVISKFGQLGVRSEYGSYYYDETSNEWKTFIEAYRNACMGLTKLDGSVDTGTLISKLDAAISALKKMEGDVRQYNVGLMRDGNGYRVVQIPQTQTYSDTFKYGDKIVFTAENLPGYRFKGMLKLDGETGIDAILKESKLYTLPTFTSSTFRANHSLVVDGNGELKITNTGMVHPVTQRAIIDGSTVTYPSATDDGRVNDSDYRLAICYIYFYEIIDAEVLFGNEFDFDKFDWTGTPNQAEPIKVDRVNNTVTLISNSSANDAYTTNYQDFQPYYMTLIPGRTYEFSCKVKNNSNKSGNASMLLFSFADAPVARQSIGTSGTDFASKSTSLSANGNGTITGTLKIPEGRPYATLRVGTSTPGISITYSDLVVRDISDYTTACGTNNQPTMPTQIVKSGAPNAEISGFPTSTRNGYTFAGWSTERQADGNGSINEGFEADGKTNILSTGNIKLYPVWKLNVKYDSNPGNASTTATGVLTESVFAYNQTDNVITDQPTLPGYTFGGWALTAEKTANETVFAPGSVVTADTVKGLFESSVPGKFYARWTPNLIIVRFKPGDGNQGAEFTMDFYFDQEQTVNAPDDFKSGNKHSVNFYDGDELLFIRPATYGFSGWQGENDGKLYGTTILNPNGVTQYGAETSVIAVWDPNLAKITTPACDKEGFVLAGWSKNADASTTDYTVGQTFNTKSAMNLYAVWFPTGVAEEVKEKYVDEWHTERVEVVSGVEFTNGDFTQYKEIYNTEHSAYDFTKFNNAVEEYVSAKQAWENDVTKSAETNNRYLAAVKNLAEFKNINPDPATNSITDHLTDFEIKYADGVTGTVPAGHYSLADMNLNHYTDDNLGDAREIFTTASNIQSRSGQSDINDSVVELAKIFVDKEDVKTTAPIFNVYDTDTSLPSDLEVEVDESKGETAGVSYVYTGKGNYTYYCYTNAKLPKIFIAINEVSGSNARICYPTNANVVNAAATLNATADSDVIQRTAENAQDYSTYFAMGMGTTLGADYYTKKDVVELSPNFSIAGDKATVTYTIEAYDDTFAPTEDAVNYADSAKLTSGAEKGNVKDIPNTENAVTPENTITIIIDYHEGKGFDVTGQQAGDDEWLKQYHLARSSGGASNWELPVSGDSVYTVYDNTYGATDYGSFTYTFNVGAANDFANCVLASADVNDVIATVKEHYGEMKAVAFDGAQEIWQWAHDKNDGNVFKYMCTHAAGTGLGFKTWSNTNWSFNYYPASGAYTYVHLVDRWGNTVDKVIQVPNLDGSAVQLHTNAAGTVEAIEVGGSGIDTMSFSAQSFEIITDENSTFDGETYTTTGNTVTVYTGEANKKYTLEANDVATNNTKENVTTDANGYLTIVVEDKAYDEGVYTFSLNGTEINLYGEVTAEPEEPTRGVTNVEYTPSTDTRNEFMFTVTGRPDKIQVIEPDGGTRTYDRYHVKVVIVSYDENGNEVSSMSRELSYEVWTIEMNVPAETELTAIARYGRDWSREAPYKYTVLLADPVFDDAVYSMSLESTEGAQGKVAATVVTGLDVTGVRFVMDNNTTATYYKSTEADGRLTYNGYAWINHAGENIIVVKIRVNNAWINAGELTYNAI